MPANSSTIALDSSVVGWLVAACGSLVMFLLGLGVKDLKDRLRKSEMLCTEFQRYRVEAERDRGELRRIIAELNGEIQRIEQRIEDGEKEAQ